MWHALAKVEREAGEDASLGVLLREEREVRGLTVEALCAEIRALGARLRPAALEQIESNRVTVTSVRPNVWAALTEYFEISRHQVVAELTMAIGNQQASRAPTLAYSDAEHAAGTQALGGAADDYLDRVRAEMGLPLATDAEPE